MRALAELPQYDGLHRRIVRDEASGSGDKRHFYYNESWQCLEERVESGGTINQYPIKQYTYFPHYIDAVSMVLYDPDTDGANITRYHYLHDANFNVVAMTDTSWNVKARYTYTPYGEVTILNGASDADGMVNEWSVDTNGSDMANEFLYTGRRLDPGTGLYYYRNRYYHAQLGQFVTRDPIRYQGGNNLYGYVGNRVTWATDPFGLRTCRCTCRPNQPDLSGEISKYVNDIISNKSGSGTYPSPNPDGTTNPRTGVWSEIVYHSSFHNITRLEDWLFQNHHDALECDSPRLSDCGGIIESHRYNRGVFGFELFRALVA